MFHIKICGIRSLRDAEFVVAGGADAIGLNFYPQSSRFITRGHAALVAEGIRSASPNTRIVGVFVNAVLAEIRRILDLVPLSTVQLHGDENPADVIALGEFLKPRNIGLIRAFRCRDAHLDSISQYLSDCRTADSWPPDAVLLDAFQPGTYGGTGAVLDWETVRRERHQLQGKPLVLAGGLNPTNVADAIRVARPDGVDVASGVETSPGVKDPTLVQAFIDAAVSAFSHNSG